MTSITINNIWLTAVCLFCEFLMVTCQMMSQSSFLTQCHTEYCLENATVIAEEVQLRSRLECSALCATHECGAMRWRQDIEGSHTCTIYQSVASSCPRPVVCTEADYIRILELSCLNGGTPISGECQCPVDYAGENCETDLCPTGACDSHCLNYGNCNCLSGLLSCTCVAGFAGTTCDSDIGPVSSSVILEVNNGFYYGTWGVMEYCDTGTYAYGLTQKVDDTYWGDSTSVNAVKLHCRNPISGQLSFTNPTSSTSEWGDWEGSTVCPASHYIVQFQMFAQPKGDDDDDSSTNNIRVKCRGPGLSGTEEFIIEGTGYDYGGQWGDWSVICESGTAVCGIQTKVTPPQGVNEDDTALDDLSLQCCELWL